jgi:hypothetical protein
MDEDIQAHCRIVMRRLREGRVIPFLGAGTNLCGRPKDASWRAGEYLPSGTELAAYLADGYGYRRARRSTCCASRSTCRR